MHMPAIHQGMSKEALKANNVFAILNLLYKKGAMPRKDIAAAIHLTPATVTMLTNEMIKNNLLVELGEITEENHAGRRKIQVDINYRCGYVAGIYIERSQAVTALSYLNGECIACETKDIRDGIRPEVLVDYFKEVIDGMIEANGLQRDQFCYIGVSVTGYVNPEKGISEDSQGLFEKNCNLKELFSSRFHAPIVIENNVRALTIAEIDFNRSSEKINGLFIKHSPGLGGALIIDNSVYSGAHFHAGELGHFTVDPEGKRCVCGKRGCISTILDRTELIRKAREAFGPDTTPALWKTARGSESNINLYAMLQGAIENDVPICRILESAATQLAIVIENSMQLINGDVVITFGPLLTNDWFRRLLDDKLDQISCGTRSYQLRSSRIGENELWKASVAVAVRKLLRLLSQKQ